MAICNVNGEWVNNITPNMHGDNKWCSSMNAILGLLPIPSIGSTLDVLHVLDANLQSGKPFHKWMHDQAHLPWLVNTTCKICGTGSQCHTGLMSPQFHNEANMALIISNIQQYKAYVSWQLKFLTTKISKSKGKQLKTVPPPTTRHIFSPEEIHHQSEGY
jgi:hypothetical protein